MIYDYFEDLSKDRRVNLVVPFAMGDNYGGYKLIGTGKDFLTKLKRTFWNIIK